MAKSNDEQSVTEQQPEAPASASLRMRTEQELEERRQMRAAEDYAPPAGVGALVNPDEKWRAEQAED